MARVAITPTTTTRGGVEPTFEAVNTGDGGMLLNTSQKGILWVKNDSGSLARTVVIYTSITQDGLPVKDQVKTLASGEEWIFGPFSNTEYGNNQYVYFDVYNEDGITVNDTTDVISGTKTSTDVTAAWIVLGDL